MAAHGVVCEGSRTAHGLQTRVTGMHGSATRVTRTAPTEPRSAQHSCDFKCDPSTSDWLLQQVIEQPVGGHVELVVGLVGAGFDLCLDLRDLVGADVAAGLEGLQEMVDAGQFEL